MKKIKHEDIINTLLDVENRIKREKVENIIQKTILDSIIKVKEEGINWNEIWSIVDK